MDESDITSKLSDIGNQLRAMDRELRTIGKALPPDSVQRKELREAWRAVMEALKHMEHVAGSKDKQTAGEESIRFMLWNPKADPHREPPRK